ncbi:zf-C2H2 zinc finger, C2H2 type [Scheffersomyces xylosifermentans]|uniref:zf-C2H2 zinc finger, C2H2 type n=1 Tax=Scheffersomyces xylosifermentans TaxID=1304137 RepID=UPI00315CCB56
MTSLAVLPPLKRSITDIMDEELYHVPNSPIQFNTRTNATQNQSMPNMTISQQQSPKLQSQQIQHQMQRSDSPAGAYANNNANALFFQSNGSNTMLPSVFNTTDTFFEQYVYNTANTSTMTNNTWSTGSFGNASISSLNDSIHNNTNIGMDIDESYSNNTTQSNSTITNPLINTAMSLFPSNVKPFTEYGNPDTFIRPQQLQNRQMSPPPAPLPQSFPARPNRRRRLTTLDEGDAHNSSKKKEEDYLLFNPNIQPSHLIDNTTNFFNDEFLFVPQNQQQQYEAADGSNVQNGTFSEAVNNSADGFVPGYENDYLLIEEDFDEEIEADLSEDEEDDEDNYFHVDDEFDQLVMNNNYNDEEFNNLDMMDMDEYLRSGSTNNNGNIVNTNNYNDITPSNIKLDKHDIMNGGFIDVKQDKINETHNSMNNEHNAQQNTIYNNVSTNDEEEDEEQIEDQDLLENDDNFSPYSMVTPPARKQSRSLEPQPHHKSAAEISLNNPNHQCDLINPATGLPCNKPFSRPYDLIRHQETIHASKKKIFRCVICEGRINGGPGNGKSKTFSRGDALSRHIKVKHGLVGKEALDIINEAKENVEYVSV